MIFKNWRVFIKRRIRGNVFYIKLCFLKKQKIECMSSKAANQISKICVNNKLCYALNINHSIRVFMLTLLPTSTNLKPALTLTSHIWVGIPTYRCFNTPTCSISVKVIEHIKYVSQKTLSEEKWHNDNLNKTGT